MCFDILDAAKNDPVLFIVFDVYFNGKAYTMEVDSVAFEELPAEGKTLVGERAKRLVERLATSDVTYVIIKPVGFGDEQPDK